MKKLVCWMIFLSLIGCGSREGDKGKDGQDGRDGKDATALAVVKNLEEVPCSTENQNRVVFSEENNGWYQCKDKWLRLGLTLTDVAHQKLMGDWIADCVPLGDGSYVDAKLSFDGINMFYTVKGYSLDGRCESGTIDRNGQAEYFLRTDSKLDLPKDGYFTSIHVTDETLLIYSILKIWQRNSDATRYTESPIVFMKTVFPKDDSGKPILSKE